MSANSAAIPYIGMAKPGCVLFTVWIVDNCLGKNPNLCGRHPTQCSSKINLDIFQPSEHIEKVFLVKKTPKKCEVIHLVQKGLFHNLFWILLCVIYMHTLLLSCFSDFCPKAVFCFEFFPLKLLGDTATPSPSHCCLVDANESLDGHRPWPLYGVTLCTHSLLPFGVPAEMTCGGSVFSKVLNKLNDEKQANPFQMFHPLSLIYWSLQNLEGFPVHLQQHGRSLMSFTENINMFVASFNGSMDGSTIDTVPLKLGVEFRVLLSFQIVGLTYLL